jgi:hypothetical protein
MAGSYGVKIISTRVVCEQPGRYIGWPSVARLRSGGLVAVFSGDRDAHVCPWGKTQMVRSFDDGESWSPEVTINNTPLDDRDAGVIETARGTLVVSWFTSLAFCEERYVELLAIDACRAECWRRHAEKLTPEIRERWLGSWIRRSEDNGQTWGPPIRVGASAPHGLIELHDGRLLYVGMERDGDRKRSIGVHQSHDDGRSWDRLSEIRIPAADDIADYSEPHVVERADGELVALIRYQPADAWQRSMRAAESLDGGRSWSVASPTELLGYPPHLLRLPDGRLLVSYGRRVPPFGERVCLSEDGGRTWVSGSQVEIAGAPNSDLGYPCSAVLGDGSILTVYYQVNEKSRLSPRPKTSLLCTRWRLAAA